MLKSVEKKVTIIGGIIAIIVGAIIAIINLLESGRLEI